MAIVTVQGAHDQTVTLTFDKTANLQLGQQLAAAITAGVRDLTILPAVDTDGPPPTLAGGTTGEFVQTKDGLTILPPGYKAFVDTAHKSVVFGSGDKDESVLSSIGHMTFIATGGSGSIAAGGGDNRIIIPPGDAGAWSINTGSGNDTIFALGGGNDTVNSGGGHDLIVLGSGHDVVNAVGSATVFGGTGSDTFHGGSGKDIVHGGTGGNNLLFAGTGPATLFCGGNGDTLFGAGSHPQALHAGSGNETLIGGAGADSFYGGSGTSRIIGGSGNDTFVAGTGTASMTAGSGSNEFVFNKGHAGGSDSIQGFTHGSDLVDLQAYAKDAVKDALKSQVVSGGSDTITLSDNTSITFVGVSNLTTSDFITTGGKNSGPDGGNQHGH
jgi:Ca2+-binding RTX toxin-like protein